MLVSAFSGVDQLTCKADDFFQAHAGIDRVQDVLSGELAECTDLQPGGPFLRPADKFAEPRRLLHRTCLDFEVEIPANKNATLLGVRLTVGLSVRLNDKMFLPVLHGVSPKFSFDRSHITHQPGLGCEHAPRRRLPMFVLATLGCRHRLWIAGKYFQVGRRLPGRHCRRQCAAS